ncbi:MAG: GNAT family N-acetyltransferase [Chloroflexi bacterium]|nr:GNAT family N-acetyltransferase [Chloroflexota bacterium]
MKKKGIYPFLVGQRIYLREVRPSDVNEDYYRWMNDPEVTRYLESGVYPNSRENLEAYVREKLGDRNSVFLAIVFKEGHRHIGNIKLGPIDWIHRLGDVGIMIGERDCWGKGYASEAISLISRYAFGRLDLHKLTAACCDSNTGSAKAFQKSGFEIEGIRKQHAFFDGKYSDVVIMGLTNPEGRNHE